MAGPSRGQFYSPEVGDEALVAFEHGDFDHPFVVGFLWNGVDQPPESDRKKRVIVSVSGHRITLDDSPGGERSRSNPAPAKPSPSTTRSSPSKFTEADAFWP